MHIQARNVNDAYYRGVGLLLTSQCQRQMSRAGEVLVYPEPVLTSYRRPLERVLFDADRDANPFFHLMEALWMLAGRNDARWLDQFVADFSSRFAEEDGHQHGAYGFRWRHHFDVEGGGAGPDQLETVIRLLKANPYDRRVVLTMWDPVADLGANLKDHPCNTQCYFRARDDGGLRPVLDLTVCCRSNDVVWGAYGANAVHFSVLLEYVAARAGLDLGQYHQFSNNFHIYTNALGKLGHLPEASPYDVVVPQRLVTDPERFDLDLETFFGSDWLLSPYANWAFEHVAVPLRLAYQLWRQKQREAALDNLNPNSKLDWIVAARRWMERRMVRLGKAHAS